MSPDAASLSPEQRELLARRLRGGLASRGPRIRRRPEELRGSAPLSVFQEQLWYSTRLAPEVPVYNEAVVIHREGPLDLGALASAFAELIRRHEIWRSTFELRGGEPVQLVHQDCELPVETVDLSSLPAGDAEEQARHLAVELAARPYQLERGPLLRLLVIRLAPDRSRIHLALHHLIFDGVSLYRVALPELVALYDAFAGGRRPELSEPDIQYGDFAVWSHEWARGEEFARRMEYWRLALGGLPTLDLPLDHPRPGWRRFRGAMVTADVDGALAERLRAASRAHGVTLFQTLAAAYAVFLHQHSGQDEIVFGTLTDMRRRPELTHMIGYCLTPLVLRVDTSGDPSWSELLGRCRERLIAALHHAVPFERLVRELAPHRDPALNPLFQAMIVLEPPMPPVDPAWRHNQLDAEVGDRLGIAKFDLHLQLDERPEGHIEGQLIYNTDLFERDTAQRFAARWLQLLRHVAADPERRISELSTLEPAERERQLVTWNATDAPIPDTPLHELVAAQVARTPHAVAAECGDEELTFAALEARARRVAADLRAAGVAPGQLVAVAMEPSLDLIVGLLGVLQARAAYLPLDLHHPPARLAWMLEDSAASIVLTRTRDRQQLPRSARRVLCIDSAGAAPASPALEAAPVGVPASGGRLSPDDVAYVIYTSGSTGRPKGVRVRQRSVVNLLTSMAHDLGIGVGDVVVALTTVSFDIAVMEVWLPLITGARISVVSRETAADARRLAELIGAVGATLVQATPSMWRMLVDAGWNGSPSLVGISGGESLDPGLAGELCTRLGVLWNMYGPTETTVYSTRGVVHPGETVTIGRPIANTHAYVLDGGGSPVPCGVPGELYIGGEGVASGYLRRPELTAERFLPDPFRPGERMYRTGDRARLLADGRIQHLGRLDDQVKIRGVRVEPGEVEHALAAHREVRTARIVAHNGGSAGTRLVAYVVPREGATPSVGQLRAHLRRLVPEHMVPAAYVVLDRLPLTSSGKLDRAALPPPVWGQAADLPVAAPPRTVLELRLAEIWAEVLDVDRVGAEDDFFELGGHSLLAGRLVAEVERRLGLVVPLAALVGAGPPTVRQMAAQIEGGAPRGESEGTTAAVPIRETGSGPILFFVHPTEESLLSLRHVTAALPPQQRVVGLLLRRVDSRYDLSQDVPQLARAMLASMRRLQPQGPYLIAGYSLGGMLAYAIAAELRASGEEVRWLALVDTLTPKGVTRFRRFQMRRERQARLHRLVGLGPAGAARRVAVASVRRSRSLGARARRALVAEPPPLWDGWDWYGALRLALGYPCRGHDAPTLLLTTESSVTAAGSTTLWWDQIHQGELTVRPIPGDHLTSMREPHVRLVAGELAASLAAAATPVVEPA